MPNFINLYFGLCLVAWAFDVIGFALIVVIKPLRKWLWKKTCEWSQEFTEMFEKIFDD